VESILSSLNLDSFATTIPNGADTQDDHHPEACY